MTPTFDSLPDISANKVVTAYAEGEHYLTLRVQASCDDQAKSVQLVNAVVHACAFHDRMAAALQGVVDAKKHAEVCPLTDLPAAIEAQLAAYDLCAAIVKELNPTKE